MAKTDNLNRYLQVKMTTGRAQSALKMLSTISLGILFKFFKQAFKPKQRKQKNVKSISVHLNSYSL